MKEQESLSSYLFRLAKLNETSFNAILQKVSLPNIISSASYRRLDNDPRGVINIGILSELIRVSEEEILRHTFNPIVIATSSQLELGNSLRTALYYFNQKRWFCPSCLKEENNFKLIWQIKSIKFCLVHKCYLQNKCSNCQSDQPYIGDHLMDIKCSFCKYPLFLNKEENVLDLMYGNEIISLYYIWESLLSVDSPITRPQFNLTIEQTICLKILFLSQSDRTKYNPSTIRTLKKNDYILLRNIILSDASNIKKSYLGCVIRFFNTSNCTLKQFMNERVSEEYYNSLIPVDSFENPGDCIAPWCEFKYTNNGMRRISRLLDRYYKVYYCSSCFITYGYKRESDQWEEVGGKINLVNRILPHIYKGSNITSILKDNKTKARIYVIELVGYIYVQKIVQSSFLIRFTEITDLDSEELLKRFEIIIDQKERAIQALFKKASLLYGWSSYEFSYYYNQREVQLLLHNTSIRVGRSSIKQKFKRLLHEYLIECDDQNKICTKTEFASLCNVSPETLDLYGLSDLLKKNKVVLQDKKKKDRISLYQKKAEHLVLQSIVEKRRLYISDVYDELGVGFYWLKRNSPNLYLWIIDQVENSRLEMEKLILAEKKEKLKEAIVFLNENDMVITKKNLIRMLGLKQLDLYKGSELSEYYNEIMDGKIIINLL